MTKPAILFDLDGTLIDTIELIMTSMEFAFAEFTGTRPTRAEWLMGLGIPLRIQLSKIARTPEELDYLIARYRLYQGEHHDRMTTAYPGAVEVLAKLHADGHPMGVVTSKFHATSRKALDLVGMLPYLPVIIGADSVVNAKPHAEPVLKALEQLGASPSHAMFVGDSPHDITAGNAAGVASVAAIWGPFDRAQLESARPTHWLDSIDDLPALVAQLGPKAPKALKR